MRWNLYTELYKKVSLPYVNSEAKLLNVCSMIGRCLLKTCFELSYHGHWGEQGNYW